MSAFRHKLVLWPLSTGLKSAAVYRNGYLLRNPKVHLKSKENSEMKYVIRTVDSCGRDWYRVRRSFHLTTGHWVRGLSSADHFTKEESEELVKNMSTSIYGKSKDQYMIEEVK